MRWHRAHRSWSKIRPPVRFDRLSCFAKVDERASTSRIAQFTAGRQSSQHSHRRCCPGLCQAWASHCRPSRAAHACELACSKERGAEPGGAQAGAKPAHPKRTHVNVKRVSDTVALESQNKNLHSAKKAHCGCAHTYRTRQNGTAGSATGTWQRYRHTPKKLRLGPATALGIG